MAQKTNKVLLATDDKDLSAAELKRKAILLEKQDQKEAPSPAPAPKTEKIEEVKEVPTSKEEKPDDEENGILKEKPDPIESIGKFNGEEEVKEEKGEFPYVVDLSLKKEDETNEAFYIRAKEQGLGHFLGEDKSDDKDLLDPLGVIKKIKDIRVNIDRVYHLANKEFLTDSEIVSKIFTAKAWLGKLLASLKAENPYANENRIKTRQDIPATADTYVVKDYQSEVFQFNLQNAIQKIIILRKELDGLIDLVQDIEFTKEIVDDIRLASICKTQSYVSLSEAKFFLGKELSKLKTN